MSTIWLLRSAAYMVDWGDSYSCLWGSLCSTFTSTALVDMMRLMVGSKRRYWKVITYIFRFDIEPRTLSAFEPSFIFQRNSRKHKEYRDATFTQPPSVSAPNSCDYSYKPHEAPHVQGEREWTPIEVRNGQRPSPRRPRARGALPGLWMVHCSAASAFLLAPVSSFVT